MALTPRAPWVALLGFAAVLGRPIDVDQDICPGGAVFGRERCWANKVVYQVITDRFARGDGSTTPCDDLKDYCGGTFKGLLDHLDYIEGLGVDAIWISPIVANVPRGYHGYWAKSLTEINPHFGTAEELTHLVSEIHRRGMLVLVDVVANHMGMQWSDIPTLSPFNESKYFHNCDQCRAAGGGVGGVGCNGTICDCWVGDYDVPEQELYCQLYGLPDLDQDNPFVREKLFEYARDLTWIYKIDGLRIDTVPYVADEFWRSFDYAAQQVFALGEVSSHDNSRVHDYVESGTLDSIINYPLYYQLLNTFTNASESVVMKNGQENNNSNNMLGLAQLVDQQRMMYGNFKIPVLGNFAECHDVDRLPSWTSDVALRKAMLLYVLAAEGIPLLYYGIEQGYANANLTVWGADARRAPLWTSGFKTEDSLYDMYDFIAKLNFLRRRMPLNDFRNAEQRQMLATEDMYVFSRGHVIVALTNAGSNGTRVAYNVSRELWTPGITLCNIYVSGDCLTVGENKSLEIVLLHGESKVYAPAGYAYDDGHSTSVFGLFSVPLSPVVVWVLLGGLLAWIAIGVAVCSLARRRRQLSGAKHPDELKGESSDESSTDEDGDDV